MGGDFPELIRNTDLEISESPLISSDIQAWGNSFSDIS